MLKGLVDISHIVTYIRYGSLANIKSCRDVLHNFNALLLPIIKYLCK